MIKIFQIATTGYSRMVAMLCAGFIKDPTIRRWHEMMKKGGAKTRISLKPEGRLINVNFENLNMCDVVWFDVCFKRRLGRRRPALFSLRK